MDDYPGGHHGPGELMSVWSTIAAALFGAAAPSAEAGAVALLDGKPMTVAELMSALEAAEAFPWAQAAKMVAAGFNDPQTDIADLEALTLLLAPLNPPVAFDAELILKAAAMVLAVLKSSNLEIKITPGEPTWIGSKKGSNPNG